MNFTQLLSSPTSYSPAQKELWTGRKTKPKLGVQYWYQQIILCELKRMNNIPQYEKHIALLGYACDEGVRRNNGRIGAAQGPDAIRKQLGRLAFHHQSKTITDYGNLLCKNEDLEFCQNALSMMTENFISHGVFSIVLGGGHDLAFGHYKGIHRALAQTKATSIGIINFDAHFDIRPIETQPNSGTPFNQIVTEFPDSVSYFVLGIQKAANPRELFTIAKEKNIDYLLHDRCEFNDFLMIKTKLDLFIKQNEVLYISIDLDGFSSAYAPAVSAPSPLGFSPNFFFKVLGYLMKSKKVVAVDLAELNPNFDRDHTTAILAARIIDAVVEGL